MKALDAKKRAISKARDIKDIRFGQVSVTLSIHDGRVVKTVYTVSETTVEKEKEGSDE